MYTYVCHRWTIILENEWFSMSNVWLIFSMYMYMYISCLCSACLLHCYTDIMKCSETPGLSDITLSCHWFKYMQISQYCRPQKMWTNMARGDLCFTHVELQFFRVFYMWNFSHRLMLLLKVLRLIRTSNYSVHVHILAKQSQRITGWICNII